MRIVNSIAQKTADILECTAAFIMCAELRIINIFYLNIYAQILSISSPFKDSLSSSSFVMLSKIERLAVNNSRAS